MPKFLARLLCKIFDHKGPHGTAYTLKRTSEEVASVHWRCPRCNELVHGIMLGAEQPGHLIDSQPSFKPSIMLDGNVDELMEKPVLVLPTRIDPRKHLSTGHEILKKYAAQSGPVFPIAQPEKDSHDGQQ